MKRVALTTFVSLECYLRKEHVNETNKESS